jgi:hypothetical protein
MAYEVRVKGATVAVHERQRDALAQVRALVRDDPDCGAEIIDTATGQPAAPAASKQERDEFAKKVGF